MYIFVSKESTTTTTKNPQGFVIKVYTDYSAFSISSTSAIMTDKHYKQVVLPGTEASRCSNSCSEKYHTNQNGKKDVKHSTRMCVCGTYTHTHEII